MRIYHPYGSKERLFEINKKVNKVVLNEEKLSKDKKEEVIKKFLNFVTDKLDLGDDMPKLILSYDNDEASSMSSFGKYTPDLNEIRVVVANRNLADVLRTIAHEIIHYRQNKDGKLKSDSNKTGSEHENEANALAGVYMREFGQKNPIIFE